MVIGPLSLFRVVDELPVALAYANPLQGEQRPPHQAAQLGEHRADPVAGVYRDDHHQDLGVAAEELSALAAAVRGPVDSRQDGGAGDAAAVQQFADHLEGGHAVDTVVAAEEESQLGGFAGVVHDPDGVDLVAEEPCSFQRDQAMISELQGLVQHRFDVRPGIDRDRGQRQVFRQSQRGIRSQAVSMPETFHAAQQDGRREPLPGVQIDERGGDEPAVDAVVLAEVTGQLDAIRIHHRAPIGLRDRAEQKPSAAEAAVRKAAASTSGHHLTAARLAGWHAAGLVR
jgi:hypothetical protein